jgi:acyl-CoA thioesterase-1
MKPAVWTLTLLLAAGTSGQDQNTPVFQPIEDVPGLPRVLLIGDSISMGYTLPVRELLRGKANVHRIPTNGGPTTRGLESLDQWLGAGAWDVIHFNWGLHDLRIMEGGAHQVPLPQYESNLRKLVAKLNSTGARLVWATTTPVPAGKLEPPRRPGDVAVYNFAAARIMEETKVATDDLYSFAHARLSRIQRPENVHFTDEGSAELATQVAASILDALRR